MATEESPLRTIAVAATRVDTMIPFCKRDLIDAHCERSRDRNLVNGSLTLSTVPLHL